jgi:hypothetical protein
MNKKYQVISLMNGGLCDAGFFCQRAKTREEAVIEFRLHQGLPTHININGKINDSLLLVNVWENDKIVTGDALVISTCK